MTRQAKASLLEQENQQLRVQVARLTEAMKKENGRIESHIDRHLMSAQLGDPEHMLFLLVITNISQVKEILNWVKQQPGVKSAFLDLVEGRIEQYDAFSQQLKRKLTQVRSAGRKMLQLA